MNVIEDIKLAPNFDGNPYKRKKKKYDLVTDWVKRNIENFGNSYVCSKKELEQLKEEMQTKGLNYTINIHANGDCILTNKGG